MEEFTNYLKGLEQKVASANLQELEELAKSKDEKTREYVALYGHLSDDLFRQLATDESAVVRCAVTVNHEVTSHVLMSLIHDLEWETRWNVAGSQNATEEILKLLLNDDEEEVRLQAQAHLDYFEQQKQGE